MRKQYGKKLIILFITLGFIFPFTAGCTLLGNGVHWKDEGFERLIRDYLNKPSGSITATELSEIKSLRIVNSLIQYPWENDQAFALRIDKDKNSASEDKDRIIKSLDDLVSFDQLTQLSISGQKKLGDISGVTKASQLTSLALESCNFKSLEPLAQLTNLTQLSLKGSGSMDNPPKFPNFDPLASLTQLKDLNLEEVTVKSEDPLSPLKALTNLTRLSLAGNLRANDTTFFNQFPSLSDLALSGSIPEEFPAQLAKLSNLTALSIRGTLSNITFLTSLAHLKSLALESTSVSDLSPLLTLTELENLELSKNTQISNIDGLGQLNHLKVFSLSLCNISDFTALANLTDLTSLTIDNNRAKTFSLPFLSSLNSLTHLSLSGNEIKDISFLSHMNQLEYLDLSSNAIQTFSPISSLTHLQTLLVDYNNVGSSDNPSLLPSLAGLKELKVLSCVKNGISDLTPLSELNKLEFIILDSNQINDLTPLSGLSSLQTLSVKLNKLKDIAPLAQLSSLKILMTSEISNLSPLSNLQNLTLLQIVGNQLKDLSPVKHVGRVWTP